MENEVFRSKVRVWLKDCEVGDVTTTIPAYSGFYRIVPVAPSDYVTGYVSMNPGSFKPGATSGNWYGTPLQVADAEVGATGERMYEVSYLLQPTPFLTMQGLPTDLQKSIHDDASESSEQAYSKSLIVLDEIARRFPDACQSGVMFESRRAEGHVLTYNPGEVATQTIYCSQTPPDLSTMNWPAPSGENG